MSNRVDSGVEPVESPDLQPVLNRIFPEPELQQLPPGDHSMLPPSQLGDSGIDSLLIARPSQPAYIAGGDGFGGHARERDGSGRTGGA